MKRLMFIIIMILSLCGCAASVPEPTPTPTPVPAPTANPYLDRAGAWTAETGDGSEVWYLEDNGRARLPAVSPDGYRQYGGYGLWAPGETITVQVGEFITLLPLAEDGFDKLYCPKLNLTLVRAEEREAAYAAKFTEVTLTNDNIRGYFRFERVPNPTDGEGNRIWKEVFVMRSTLYDQGLVYWDERDVELDFRYWTSYHMEADKMPFGVSFLVENYIETRASGTLVFIKADHLTEQFYDGKTRRLVCSTGEVREEVFETYRYGEYPY